jgi:GntR family transcriptional regulator
LIQIDRSSAIPLYKQVEKYIRDLIESGEYDNGKLLPKEEELANQFGISRNTVRKGMYNLVIEGLLVRKKGIGTIASPHTITTHLDEWHSFTQEMSQRGITLKNYSLKVNREPADKTLAEAFQIEEGTNLVKLERLLGDEKKPFVIFVSWIHPRTGLTGKENFNQPLYQILEEEFSIYPSRSSEELKAVPADEEIADYLNIREGDPVLFRKRRVYDVGDRIIEYNTCFYRGDRFTYSIDIKRKFE